jgi:hypothetical protein
MKTLGMLYLSLLILFSGSALAHHGPASTGHLIEHLLLILAIGLPLFYGFKRLLTHKKQDDER